MRVFARLLIVGTAVLVSGCSLDYIPGLLPDPPRASSTPRVAAHYSPADHRVIYVDPASVEYAAQ